MTCGRSVGSCAARAPPGEWLHVHHRTDELNFARLIWRGTGDDENFFTLHPASAIDIREQNPAPSAKARSTTCRNAATSSRRIRTSQPLQGRGARWVVLKDAKGLLGPVNFPAGGSPPNSPMAVRSGLAQIGFTAPQFIIESHVLSVRSRPARRAASAPRSGLARRRREARLFSR